MSNTAGGPVDPGSTPPVPGSTAQGPVSTQRKKHGATLVIAFGLLGAGAAAALVLASRSIAAPAASPSSTPSPRPAAAPRLVPEPVTPSKWTSGARWVSDRKSVAFELRSNNRVSVWMGQVQPLLVIRCVANRTEAFVYTETAAKIEPGMDDRAVRVSFDDDPWVGERWPDSAEHKGLFAPNGETFTQRVMNARTFRFEFTPHNAAAADVEFNVAGLRELIEPVQKKCGWDK